MPNESFPFSRHSMKSPESEANSCRREARDTEKPLRLLETIDLTLV
jgi:hypothetical protein